MQLMREYLTRLSIFGGRDQLSLSLIVLTNYFSFSDAQTLEFFEFAGANKWAYVGYEFIFVVAVFFIAWAGFAYKQHGKR